MSDSSQCPQSALRSRIGEGRIKPHRSRGAEENRGVTQYSHAFSNALAYNVVLLAVGGGLSLWLPGEHWTGEAPQPSIEIAI
jgi:hypothetical protein